MADLLDSVIARTLGPPAVRPRARALFEPVRPGWGPGHGADRPDPAPGPTAAVPAAGEHEPAHGRGPAGDPERPVAPAVDDPHEPPGHRRTPQPAPASMPVRATPPTAPPTSPQPRYDATSDTTPVARDTAPAPRDRAAPDRVAPATSDSAPLLAATAASRDTKRFPEPSFGHTPAAADRESAVAPPALSSDLRPDLDTRLRSLVRGLVATGAPGLSPLGIEPGGRDTPGAPAPTLRPAPAGPGRVIPRSATFSPPMVPPLPAAEPRTLVQVSIGRVEVRATPETAKQRAAPRDAGGPTALEAYLNRRNGTAR